MVRPHVWCVLLLALAAACAPRPAGPGDPLQGPGAIQTVFLVVMENHTWAQVEGNDEAPFINDTMLPSSSYALEYKGPGIHPSEPNYIWLEAGDNLGITDDGDPADHHLSTTEHLVTQLETAGFTWASYQQGISGDVCPLTATGDYAPKHNPMVFFDDATDGIDPESARCIAHQRPLTELEDDLLDGTVPQYAFIVPDLCHDMHDECAPTWDSMRQGDDWLAEWVPKITSSAAYQEGALFVTWDESDITFACPFANCPIGMIVMSPFAKGGGYTNRIHYTHSSTLRTVETIFGVPPLRDAAEVADLRDLFDTFP